MIHLHRNIILIGMPGAGKSTVGVILAKTLGMQFIDCDILIQQRTRRMLQEILDEDGPEVFRQIEEEVILSLSDPAVHHGHAVIATGGSVVWSRAAMEHLKSMGMIVYLETHMKRWKRDLKTSRPGG